ncbi:MAG: FliM/FliN family flagellar motor switch protein [Phycisphaerae bacterium]|nr:FliM/FliN family flagellar motor switch protein [Phycisphaerae bacterium]
MPETQEDIDALLAEVNSLADQAVADILGDQPADGSDPLAGMAPAPSAAAPPGPRRADIPENGASAGTPHRANVSRVLKLHVPVIVQLAERSMPLSEIVSLTTGAIIEFEKPADTELDLMINNKCIGRGQAVKVGENFGLRVTLIGSVKSRIMAMAKR